MLAYSQEWKRYLDSAQLFHSGNQTDQAIGYYLKAAGYFEKNDSACGEYAVILDSLAMLYIQKNDYRPAETYYIKALNLRRDLYGENSLVYAVSAQHLGYLYGQLLGKFSEAGFFLHKALRIHEAKKGKFHPSYAAASELLAHVLLRTSNPDSAQLLFRAAANIRIAFSGRNSMEYFKAMEGIGMTFFAKSYYDSALHYYLIVADFYKQQNRTLEIGFLEISQRIAAAYKGKSELKKAREILESVRNNIINTGNRKSQLYRQNCSRLGEVYAETGNYRMAELVLKEGMELEKELVGEHSNWYGAFCHSIGFLYYKTGRYSQAEAYYLMSKKNREQNVGRKNLQYAQSCESLAELYITTGKWHEVEALLLECKSARESVGGDTFSNYYLGYFYLLVRQPEQAMTVLKSGKKTLEKTRETKTEYYLATLRYLAKAYQLNMQYDTAKSLLLECRDLILEIFGEDHPEFARINKELAEIEWKKGNFKAAHTFYEKALYGLEAVCKRMFDYATEMEKDAYLKVVADFRNSFFSFAVESDIAATPKLAYEAALFYRNLVLRSVQDLHQLFFNSTDTLVKSNYISWTENKTLLSFWYSQPKTKRPAELKQLEQATEKLERTLLSLLPAESRIRSMRTPRYNEIKNHIRKGEAMIEFMTFNYQHTGSTRDSIYYIALLTKAGDTGPEIIRLFEQCQLDTSLFYKGTSAQVIQLNKLYTAESNTMYGNTLYRLIWEPLELALREINTVYFAPAGSLFKVAFAALPVKPGKVLSDVYNLIQLNSTAAISDSTSTKGVTAKSIHIVGGIHYNLDPVQMKLLAEKYTAKNVLSRSLPEDLDRDAVQEFYYLEGTEIELQTIAEMARSNTYITSINSGMLATEESFKSVCGSVFPSIIHIATHGFFFPDPRNEKKDDRLGGAIVFRQSDNPMMRSGLAFAGANNAWKGKPIPGIEDGILTAFEVSNMYLPNTRLVVVSACETGLGDIQGSEGVYGLQRAFKIAGVEYLLMSLWRVDDKATVEFMQEFYKHLFPSENISYAFQNAQVILKNRYRNDPHKWAAWVLIR